MFKFHVWNLCNSRVTGFWLLPLEHYLKLVLTFSKEVLASVDTFLVFEGICFSHLLNKF